MDEKLIFAFVNEFPIPCSVHKIIYHKDGSFKDGEYLSINRPYEILFDKKSPDIIGKTIISANYFEEDKIKIWLKECSDAIKENMIVDDILYCVTNKREIGTIILPLDDTYFIVIYSAINKESYIGMRSVTRKNKQLIELADELTKTNEKLKDLAVRDKITNLFNRTYFDYRITDEIEKADMLEKPLSIITYDMDYFKSINDKYGHPIGDEVLRFYADILGKYVRNEDFACRIGGEEFALVMPNTTLENAEKIADRIRDAFQETLHPIAGKVTASFGVAQREQGELFSNWYKRADKALYIAKNKGRNRVIISRKGEIPIALLSIDWDNSWNSGNVMIDFQHKEILEIAVSIHDSLYSSAPYGIMLNQIKDLENHIRTHFIEEISIIRQAGYENWKEHQLVHKELLTQFINLENDFLGGKGKASVFFNFILDEIVSDHLVKEDFKYFSCLEENKKSKMKEHKKEENENNVIVI